MKRLLEALLLCGDVFLKGVGKAFVREDLEFFNIVGYIIQNNV